MNCCHACFLDPFLADRIQTLGAIDTCDSCGLTDVPTLDRARLADYFEPLMALYVPNLEGEPAHRLLQRDWNLFASDNECAQAELLQEILSELGVTAELFSVGYEPAKDLSAQWEAFSAELKYTNRFLPDSAPEADIFAAFGQHLGSIFTPSQGKLFRARISEDGHQFVASELLKPPADVVTNGRANPLGIPYLYVASDPETAIAEVRGHKGDRVTVIEFDIAGDLDLFDLRAPRSTVSPFRQLDDVAFIHEHLPFFELLGRELSRPVTPRKANLDYLPSQYLCEVIKKAGHHGILYRSSIAAGFNCVVFADERLTVGPMHEFEITEMNYRAEYVRAL